MAGQEAWFGRLALYLAANQFAVVQQRRSFVIGREKVMGDLSDLAKRMAAAKKRHADFARELGAVLDRTEESEKEAFPIATTLAHGMRRDAMDMENEVRQVSNLVAALGENPTDGSPGSEGGSKNGSGEGGTG